MGENQIYRVLRDDSPMNDLASARDVFAVTKDKSHSKSGREFSTPPRVNGATNGHYKKNCDKNKTPNAKDICRRRNNSTGGGILPSVLTNQHILGALPSSNLNYSNLSCSTPPLSPSVNSHKTQSLPLNSSINDLDAMTLSALRITPEELAGQITLLDLPSFIAIQPDELSSCAWTKKDKYIVAPNVVGFTRRFNHTSFWTITEILTGPSPKKRAEIMAHFIKV